VVRVLGEIANHFLRMVDFKSSQNVDQFIANSEEVKGRIQKFYRKDAVVVYPPVNTSIEKRVSSIEYKQENPRRNTQYAIPYTPYYVAGGRLARAKHVDLIVKTCAENNLPLKVFGKGFAGYENELRVESGKLRNDSKNNIEFLGEVSDEEKYELLRNAKAYIFAAEDEDFGILPVEAMAAGTPVIAYRSGGVQETVIDPSAGSGQGTGLFFNELTTESLAEAVKQFEKMKFDPKDCEKRAEQFSKERFVKQIQAIINTTL
jgi:glycosyltransferase involved in cell wall biosynthesis